MASGHFSNFLISFAVLCTIVTMCQSDNILLQETLYGEVGATNYTYYTFPGDLPLKLILTLKTLSGDADLYVSGRRSKPTFDLDEHNFQSVTCGEIDQVIVPSHFTKEQSPIGIGVYGHPRSDKSRFVLEVIGIAEDADETNGYDEEKGNQSSEREELEEDDEEPTNSVSWELLVSVLAAIVKIIFEVLT